MSVVTLWVILWIHVYKWRVTWNYVCIVTENEFNELNESNFDDSKHKDDDETAEKTMRNTRVPRSSIRKVYRMSKIS